MIIRKFLEFLVETGKLDFRQWFLGGFYNEPCNFLEAIHIGWLLVDLVKLFV
jgi:hypothetical protein